MEGMGIVSAWVASVLENSTTVAAVASVLLTGVALGIAFSNESVPPDKAIASRRLAHARDLLRELVSRDMKVRYKRSVIGTVWSILNPLAQLVVLYFVFHYILPTNIPNFVAFLLTGILVWSWFSSALSVGTGAIVDNAVLIRRPGFPIALLPVVSVMTQLIHFLLALPILILFVLFSQLPLTPAVLALPLVIAIQFVLILSLTYGLATFHVTFRDTKYLLEIFLMFGFYLSPIFYQPTSIPEQFQPIYNLNPMVHIIGAYRSILLEGRLPPLFPLAVIGMVSIILLVLGFRLFRYASYRFVEEL
jgi:lipopolysaccharide transport system permease protein